MSFKRILLPVNDQDDISLVANFAFTLADAHKAEVQGIFPQDDVTGNYWLDNYGLNESEIEKAELQREKKAAEAARRAKKKFTAYAKKHEKVNANLVSTFGEIGTSLLDHAFCSDVIVLGNTTHQGSPYWRALADELLVQSTRPVIVAPSRPVSAEVGDRIVLAWKHGVESARAVAAAMPLIEKAKQVEIVTWERVKTGRPLKPSKNTSRSMRGMSKRKCLIPRGETQAVCLSTRRQNNRQYFSDGGLQPRAWRERTFGVSQNTFCAIPMFQF